MGQSKPSSRPEHRHRPPRSEHPEPELHAGLPHPPRRKQIRPRRRGASRHAPRALRLPGARRPDESVV